MTDSSYFVIWFGLSALVAFIAWLKNRSALSWFFLSLLLSPPLVFVALLVVKNVETYTHDGEKSLNNESYKIYLTKQYQIQKIETIGKFECGGKTFEDAISAMRYVQSADRNMSIEDLEKIDPIIDGDKQTIDSTQKETHSSPQIESPYVVTPNPITQQTGGKKTGASGILIFCVVIAGLGAIYWQFGEQLLRDQGVEAKSLYTKPDVPDLKPDGKLAEAFNLGSKYTDLQREQLLKEISGKIVDWTLEVYEVKKVAENVYEIQTSGGLNINPQPVSAFIKLHIQNSDERKIVELIKTGDKIRFKGVLTGTTFLRSLIIDPAILWNPIEKKSEQSPNALTTASAPTTDENKETTPDEFLKRSRESGEVIDISPELVLAIEREEYIHIPGKQPGPYQCSETGALINMRTKTFLRQNEIIRPNSEQEIFNAIKANHTIDPSQEATLFENIKSITFGKLDNSEFILIDQTENQNCQLKMGPYKTDSIRMFLSDYVKSQLK